MLDHDEAAVVSMLATLRALPPTRRLDTLAVVIQAVLWKEPV